MPLAASLSGCLRFLYDHTDSGESPEMSPISEFCNQDHDIADIRPVIEEIHQFEQRQILYYVRFLFRKDISSYWQVDEVLTYDQVQQTGVFWISPIRISSKFQYKFYFRNHFHLDEAKIDFY